MEISELLKQGEKFVKALEVINQKKKIAEYNLFNLSSYNNQRENFHTDVIASLLDINGLHYENRLLLNLFIDFLNNSYGYKINKGDYHNAIVNREFSNQESRIDLLIVGNYHCIIIENKMNDAPDMDNQISRYYNIAKNDLKLNVDAIVYLTIDGLKNAPIPSEIDAQKALVNIGAFTNCDSGKTDLIDGWLNPCYENCKNDDTKSLINQYIKLIKHLNASCMENKTLEEVYQLLNNKEKLDTLKTLNEFNSKIPFYRINKIAESINDYTPFKRKSPNKTCPYWYFDNYKEDNNSFNFNIGIREDHSIHLKFFMLAVNGEEAILPLKTKLNSISMLDEFKPEGGVHWGYAKIFSLEESFTLQELDKKVVGFISLFFNRLREIKN